MNAVCSPPPPLREITTEAMLAELTITFPALWKRRLRDFGRDHAHMPGVWIAGDRQAAMPDELPIFNDLVDDVDDGDYNGFVHRGFEAWLAARGWACDRYDGLTFWLLPSSHYDEPITA